MERGGVFASKVDPQISRNYLSRPMNIEALSDDASRLADLVQRGKQLDVTHCLARSWNLLLKHFWLLFGTTGLVFIITIGVEFIPVVGSFIGMAFGLVLWAGLDWLFLKLIRGEPATFADAFAGFKIQFPQLVAASIISSVLVVLGILFCVLPGLYLIITWLSFGPILIIDKRLGSWEGLELSRKVATGSFWTITTLFLLTIALIVGGLLALGVGLFLALPLTTGAKVYAYEDIFNPMRDPTPADNSSADR